MDTSSSNCRCLDCIKLLYLIHMHSYLVAIHLKLWDVVKQFTQFDIAFLQHFVPAPCTTKFNKLYSWQHVAGIPNCRKIRVPGPYNYQDTRGDIWLRHIPGTCTCFMFVCVSLMWFCPYCVPPVTCPCYMSPLHVPDFFAATCPCVMTRRVRGDL